MRAQISEFWSFTVYASAHSAINRHSRGDRRPDAGQERHLAAKGDANYLPIPEKDAYIILRMYGPSKDISDHPVGE